MPTDNELRLIAALRRCIRALEQIPDPSLEGVIESSRDEIHRIIPACNHDLLEPENTIEVLAHGPNGMLVRCRSCELEYHRKFNVASPAG